MNKIIVIVGLLALCASPALDHLTINTVGDEAAYEVCWNRAGPVFPLRWSCEMNFRSNWLAYAIGCAFDKGDPELCAAVKRVGQENDRRTATPAASSKPTSGVDPNWKRNF